MTIEELKEIAEGSLDFGLEHLRQTGELNMMFHLVRRDGTVEIAVAMPDVTNDEDAKRGLSRMIKARAQSGELEAVIMLSDTFFAENMNEGANKIRLALGMTIEQAAAAGLCEKREAVMVRLESPIYWLHMQQEYMRDPQDGRRIEVKGEPMRTDSLDGGPNHKARFTQFFGEPRGEGPRVTAANGRGAARAVALPPPGSPQAPKYWKDETSGVLALAVAVWLEEPAAMMPYDFKIMRAYCMQWADSPAWDMNPHMSADGRLLLADLRRLARGIESARTLAAWIEAADALGMDPL